jgi:CRP/FNR family transcriptional regulator, anaerobic regulatory protein
LTDYDDILNNICRFVSLSNSDKEELIDIIQTKKVSKNGFIVTPNAICKHQTYVLKGSFRSYYIAPNGIEHTIQFAIEDWFISDFNSYITQTPASLYVEAMENSVIQQLAYEDVESLCENNHRIERYFRLVAQKAFAFSQKRTLSNLGKTAEERYIEFRSLYPKIEQRVPQYALASYLGITPEFLSKVKKKVFSES